MNLGRAASIALAAAATPACGSTFFEPMTITDVIENIDRLNGRTVRVAGYLGVCRGYDCQLFRNESDKLQFDASFEEMRRTEPGRRVTSTIEPPSALGIGSDENFDARAEPFQGTYVVITGRVTNVCRFNGRPDCTDRGPDLHPVAIERWQPSGGEGSK